MPIGTINKKAIRNKKRIQQDVTKRFNLALDAVVGKMGKIKNYGEAAELVGLQQYNLSKIQKGERAVPLESAIAACDMFGISREYMFGTEKEMFVNGSVDDRFTEIDKRLKELEKLSVKKVRGKSRLL